jgi:hypothetical protein
MRVHLLVKGWNVALNLGAGLALSLAVVGCTFSPNPASGVATGTGNPGTAATSGGTGNPFGGSSGTGTGTGSGRAGSSAPNADGPNCGQSQYGLENIPPDLLIILDKSGSMAQQADGTACPRGGGACPTAKWPQMTAALEQVVMQTQGTIRWGLKYFANNGTCGVDPGAAVPVAPMNAAPIIASIGNTNPGGSTPTRLAEASGAMYLMGLTDPNPKFILLATDGLPNCAPGAPNGDSDAMGAEQAVLDAAMAGFPTFVVGVGDVTDAVTTLTQMAINGGRPQVAAPRYYPVSTTADLVAVLGTIGGQITSCSFNLGKVPPDPNNIAVLGDGKQIPKDPANGWSYGAGMTSIQLNGTACDNVKNKTVKNIQAIFGCPGEVIIIP